MWIIIERAKENPQSTWISGVFKKLQDAQEYLSLARDFHKNCGCTSELREIPAQDYPVMFVDDLVNCEFIYVTFEELADQLFALEKLDDEDHQYGIYHIFREDYQGIRPGEEHIRITDHHHVDNNELKSLLKIGLEIRTFGFRGLYSCENCGRLTAGILSEKGFGPPPGWQIIPNDGPNSQGEGSPKSQSPAYFPICSEKCREELVLSLPI